MNLDEILNKPAVQAAPKLLGRSLVRHTGKGVIKIKIVETEAYHQDDPASHSFKGITTRTAPMFQSGGRLYVYFTYGKHYCLNIVTGVKGVGEAVLIRAGQPLEGIEIMQANRGNIKDIKQIANGPGKLAQALGIRDTALSGKILNKSSIFLEPPQNQTLADEISISQRVGIRLATDRPWRFYISGSPYVSGYEGRVKKVLSGVV